MKAARVFAAFFAGMLCASGGAWSQAFPAKPVRVIVPFPPGGANDIVARIVLPKVSEQMGQSFIIENRARAGGTIGSAVVAQSKPDGYTLLVQTVASHVSNPHLYRKLPYDALRDFVGISPLARVVSVLTVHPSLPARSVKEFIAHIKTNRVRPLSAQTLDPTHRVPEELAQRLRTDYETIGKLFRQFDVKLD